MKSNNKITSCFAVFLVTLAALAFTPAHIAHAAVLVCWPDLDMDGFGDGSQPSFEPQDFSCDIGQQESDNDLDCDDTDDTIYPGAPETPGDGVDQDCDGIDAAICYLDADADGYGGMEATEIVAADGICDTFEYESDVATDCNDGNSSIYPGAPETWADGIDSDCDAEEICYTDYDVDGWGISVPKQSLDMDCNDVGESDGQQLEDCDDTNDTVNPGTAEVMCDGLDNDCEAATLDNPDWDQDGFGACIDCDDDDKFNWPGNLEVCDAQDNDCDVLIDEDTTDTDADELCDLIDPDADGDSVANIDELDIDSDQDGVEDWLDPDDDGDSVLTIDEDPDGNGDPLDDDTDDDGVPNYLDTDDDGDGLLTIDEDANGDGDPTNDDSDGDGIPDYLDVFEAPDLVFDDGFEGDDSTTYTIGYCSLQEPVIINETEGTGVNVYGRLWIAGLTDTSVVGNDPAPEVIGYVGYGADGSDPSSGWAWTAGIPNPDYNVASLGFEENNDEYLAVITIPPPGDYDFAFRFSGDSGVTFTYCDADPLGSSNGYNPADAGQMTALP